MPRRYQFLIATLFPFRPKPTTEFFLGWIPTGRTPARTSRLFQSADVIFFICRLIDATFRRERGAKGWRGCGGWASCRGRVKGIGKRGQTQYLSVIQRRSSDGRFHLVCPIVHSQINIDIDVYIVKIIYIYICV